MNRSEADNQKHLRGYFCLSASHIFDLNLFGPDMHKREDVANAMDFHVMLNENKLQESSGLTLAQQQLLAAAGDPLISSVIQCIAT